MKMVKILMLLVITLNVLSAFSKRRSHSRSHTKYDRIQATMITKIFFNKLVDPTKDTLKIYSSCLDLFADNFKAEPARKKLSREVDTVLANTNYPFTIYMASDFLKTVQFDIKTPDGKSGKCEKYVATLLINNSQLLNPTYQQSIKDEIEKIMGTRNVESKAKMTTMITNFATYNRRNALVTGNLVKTLNGRSLRRMRRFR